jgi:hypothetical protein
VVPRAAGKTKLGTGAVANVLWDTPITKPQGASVPTWSRNAYKDSSLPNSTVSTPEELSAWLRDLAARVVGNPKKRVQIKQEALVKKTTTIYIEFCDTEIWTARKPRRVAIGPQEFVAPWHVAGPYWVTPSFTVIPTLILDHSQPACAKRLTNFCPNCFTRSETIEHKEHGFTSEGKWNTTRVFTRTEKRFGVYVPQIHDCGEWFAA